MTSNRSAKEIKNRKIKNRKLKKRKRNKKVLKFLIGLLAIGLIGYGANEMIFGSNSKKEEYQKIEETDYLSKIPEEVRNSSDQLIKGLLEKVNEYPDVITILNNIGAYPRELLEFAEKKDEAIEFVANYPNYYETKNEKISIKKEYKKGKIPHFIQWDERWGYEKYGSEYMAISGCGPTSLAMVVVGLTGNTNINPKVIAEFSEENGYVVDGVGSAWTLMSDGAENFGLRSEELPLSEDSIIDTLKSGQPIIASMGPGTFTTSGHFVVLTGVDKNNRIIINDSDSKIRSEQTWDVDVFMKEADNLWTFTVM